MREASWLWIGILLVAAPTVAAKGLVDAPALDVRGPMHELGVPVVEPADYGLRRLEETANGAESGTSPIGPLDIQPDLEATGWLSPEVIAIAVAVSLVGLAGAVVYGGTRYVTREDVLKNDVRGRIYAYIREQVGANLKQITDDLSLTTTNAIWHLRKLEDAGLVHSRRFNGYKVFYPADGGVGARRMSLCITALQNGNAQEVFEFVVANPGAHQREIARALGVNHGTVRWHLKKLRRAELLTEMKRGKTSAYYATDVGLEALRTVAERRPVTVPVQAVEAPLAPAPPSAVVGPTGPLAPPAPPAPAWNPS